jgi:hypothetical protein
MLSGLTFASPNAYYTSLVVQSAAATASLWFHGGVVSGPATAALGPLTGTRDPGLAVNAADAVCSGASAGALGEILILDHAATPTERLTIEEYLHRKWDI